jgi:hypothetical protein
MVRVGVVLALAVGCVANAACTTSQFKPAVASFDEATQEAKEALDDQSKTLRESLEASADVWALASPGRNVEIVPGDCVDTAPRCRLVVGTPSGQQAPFTPSAGYVTSLMQAVADYASALEAVAAAGDPGALNKATDSLKTSILNFAGTATNAAKLAGVDASSLNAKATAAAAPLTEIAKVALRRYVDRRKVAAIRAAVLGMEPILDDVIPIFERTAELARRLRISAAEAEFQNVRRQYLRGPVTAKLLRDMRSAAIAYDGVLQTDPTDIFTKLREAHRALARGLKGRTMSFADLWPALEELSAEAAKVAVAAKQLQEIKSGN